MSREVPFKIPLIQLLTENIKGRGDRPFGGEFNTFTEVAAFGPGVVDVLNEGVGLPAGPPIQECLADAIQNFAGTGLASGSTRTLSNLAPGVYLFQSCFHPWMRATVTVVN
jgi:hypothetical protein